MDERKRVVFLTSNQKQAERVFPPEMRQKIGETFHVTQEKVLTKKMLQNDPNLAKDANYIFTTWGMEQFTKDEIKVFFPHVEAVFYAAGSVQHFAAPFIESGIRVFSAFSANAIPVTEFTYAQILLAAKGFFRAAKYCRFRRWAGFQYSDQCGGMYQTKVGILGVGAIGRAVAEKLQDNDVELYYFDPFLPKEVAERLHLKEASLEEIFRECDVITNHLANKDELTGVLSGELFASMKPYATFINTGRGRQVDEKGLVKAMRKVKTRTALLDVTYPEPAHAFGRLHRCKNIILTPHIAGSNGREVVRMAQFMYEEAQRFCNGEALCYEVTEQMLKTMA